MVVAAVDMLPVVDTVEYRVDGRVCDRFCSTELKGNRAVIMDTVHMDTVVCECLAC